MCVDRVRDTRETARVEGDSARGRQQRHVCAHVDAGTSMAQARRRGLGLGSATCAGCAMAARLLLRTWLGGQDRVGRPRQQRQPQGGRAKSTMVQGRNTTWRRDEIYGSYQPWPPHRRVAQARRRGF
jgi:hypothetical protein